VARPRQVSLLDEAFEAAFGPPLPGGKGGGGGGGRGERGDAAAQPLRPFTADASGRPLLLLPGGPTLLTLPARSRSRLATA